jgi:hypothetical protein
MPTNTGINQNGQNVAIRKDPMRRCYHDARVIVLAICLERRAFFVDKFV